jgi:hypothetical protein
MADSADIVDGKRPAHCSPTPPRGSNRAAPTFLVIGTNTMHIVADQIA